MLHINIPKWEKENCSNVSNDVSNVKNPNVKNPNAENPNAENFNAESRGVSSGVSSGERCDSQNNWDNETKIIFTYFILFSYYYNYDNMIHNSDNFNKIINNMNNEEKYLLVLQFVMFAYENYFKSRVNISDLEKLKTIVQPIKSHLLYTEKAYKVLFES